MRPLAACLVGALLLFHCSIAVAAESEEGSEVDPETYRIAARTGIVAGVTLDILGFLGVMSGVILVMEDHEDAGMNTMIASGGVIVLGSVVSSAGQTARHRAYLDAGLEPRPNLVLLSWIFTLASAGFYAGSVAAFAEYNNREPVQSDAETIGEAIGEAVVESVDRSAHLFGMLMLLGLAIHAEGFTLACLRPLWRRELGRAEKTTATSLSVHPVVLASGRGDSRARVWGVGVSGTF